MVVVVEDVAMAGTMVVVEEDAVGGGDVEEEEVGGTITITMIDVKVVDRRRDRIIGGRNRHQHKGLTPDSWLDIRGSSSGFGWQGGCSVH